MWKQAGTLYVYFTYGMHHCMNIVAGPDNAGCAVLIRAIEPTHGLPIILANRPGFTKPKDLCSGPAKVCQALAVDRNHDGLDLTVSDQLWLETPPAKQADKLADYKIVTGPRVGIAYAQDWKDKPLRYGLSGHPCLSRPAL
jgi:DNA-3-methyladenine glycosylase